jgi:iron complex transport system substrate-binding protein
VFSAPARLRASNAAALVAAALLALSACGEPAPRGEAGAGAEGAVSVVDDAGRTVTLPRPARRIVTLIPSATETLVELGAKGALVGRTDYDLGLGVDSLPSVGGGLDPSLETVVSLRPDLVIGWETDGPARLRDRLTSLGIPVFSIKTEDTTDVFRAIRSLGALTGRGAKADSLSTRVRGELEAVRRSVAGRPRPRVFYLVWNDPPTTAGPKTFITQVIQVAGAEPVFPEVTALWPTVSLEELVRRQPDHVIVPVGEAGTARLEELRRTPGWRELRGIQGDRALVVPSLLLNRPGPSIGAAARRMRDAIHPELAGR